jgi:hypothetical protein
MHTTNKELHELVDRLSPEQASAVRDFVRDLVGQSVVVASDDDASQWPARSLSFTGTLHSGKGDLAARAKEIIRVGTATVAGGLRT